jgi:hypothetical protein
MRTRPSMDWRRSSALPCIAQLEATFRNPDFGQSVELAYAKAQDAIKGGPKRPGLS